MIKPKKDCLLSSSFEFREFTILNYSPRVGWGGGWVLIYFLKINLVSDDGFESHLIIYQ